MFYKYFSSERYFEIKKIRKQGQFLLTIFNNSLFRKD